MLPLRPTSAVTGMTTITVLNCTLKRSGQRFGKRAALGKGRRFAFVENRVVDAQNRNLDFAVRLPLCRSGQL